MSLKLSYPEKTNLYLTHLNNKSKIQVFIPDVVLKCENYEDFSINVIQFNTFHDFYRVKQDNNNTHTSFIDELNRGRQSASNKTIITTLIE